MAINNKKTPDKKKKPQAKGPLDSRGVNAAIEAEASGEDGDKATAENWADKPDHVAYEQADKLYDKIAKSYENKGEQTDRIEEYWNCYNAIPDDNAQYSGNSTCYIPAVRDAINARMKRSLSQLFPTNQKHVEAVSSTGEIPYPQLALLEHYIRKLKLKNIIRADLIAGDVTGQWGLYVDWTKSYRTITEVVRKPVRLAADNGAELDGPDEQESLKEREIVTEGPSVVPFAAEDLAVYPPTCNDIEESIASSIKLRMSKDKVRQMIDEGVFVGIEADDLVDNLGKPDGVKDRKNPAKKRTQDAGIRTEGTYKYALIYEVATNLDLDDTGTKVPALVYFAGQNSILGIIRSPWWSGRRPTISAPIEHLEGSFFGISKIEPVKFLQWNLNDYWNMGMDSAQYALLPIVMTDPLKNPQYQSMVMGLAAVWLADPNSTKFQAFPALYKEAIPLCNEIKAQIWQSMDVNDAMMGKMPAGRKNAGMVGQMQQEQQINITDHAKRYEEMILNPLVERIFELDRQFRTEELTVQTRGEMGVRARIDKIPPQNFDEQYFFQWAGTSYVMNTQRMQQMISWMNVLRGIPPQLLGGRRLDITPILEQGTEHIFGPEVAPHILVDDRNLFTIPPDEENMMLHNGLPVEVHEGDNDVEHIRIHNQAAVLSGDPSGHIRSHISAHAKAMQAKMQKQMGAQQPGGVPGIPGGQGPGGPQPAPGVAGLPRIGAQPMQPRPQQPPGAIHADQMLGGMPRG